MDTVHSSRDSRRTLLPLFHTILTDRGTESGTSIYYCDPMCNDQKGWIEQACTMLHMILPKKTSFEFLTQWDVRTIVDHIYSTPREILGGRTHTSLPWKTTGSTF